MIGAGKFVGAYFSITYSICVSIFVPSNRNTLGDILCGRSAAPSPRKPRKPRSESVSPRKGLKGTLLPEVKVSEAILGRRTSPRKPSRKPVCDELEARLEPVAGT